MNRRVLMAAFSGIVLSIILFLYCGFVDGYNFEVNKIEECPRNKTEWSERSKFLKCNESKGYTCLPNENLTELLEFCYRQPKITVPKGVCLFLRSADVDGYNCHNFTDGCPNSTYFSDEVYKYPNCLFIANGCFRVDSNCKSDKSIQPTTRKVYSTKTDAYTFKRIVLGLYLVFAIIFGLFLLDWRRRMDCKNRGNVINDKCLKNIPKENADVHELLKNIMLRTEDILKTKDICGRLFTACQNGEVNDVQQYLNNNDGIQTCNIKQILPLYVACYKGHTDIVKILLENYEEKFTKDGHSPYQFNHKKENCTNVQQLLNMNAYGLGGDRSLFEMVIFSPLHIACQKGNRDVVDHLLQNGADVNLCSADGTCPLYLACQEGHGGTVLHLLLEKNVDVDHRNNAGKSPLHVACLKNHIDIVKYLLIKGANINVRDNKGKSPLDLALDHGLIDLAQFLKDKGATSKY